MARKSRQTARLPKAPLAEVVFELRWALQGATQAPPILQSDPGILPLLERFTRDIKKVGFGTINDMSPPLQTAAYGIVRRFYKEADKPFPIMQIGPGIFATNESSEYDWTTFKAQIHRGLRTLLGAYPNVSFFALVPNHLELRYIDVFTKSLFGNAAFFQFVERGTSLKFGLPPMLKDRKVIAGNPNGRFAFHGDLKGWENSKIIFDLAAGRNEQTKEDVVRMETKIISTDAGVPKAKKKVSFFRSVDNWLEFAHGITSPLFKELVLPEAMQKFAEK
jgi:uncharacterized protein (TIGR04255 family)